MIRRHLVPLCAALAVVALRFAPVYDPDAFWHLATGRWILAHREIPTVDHFSHTAAGRSLRFVDALADVLLHATQSLGGFGALALLTGLTGALAVFLALRGDDEGPGWPAQLLVAAPLVGAVVFRVTPRPQTFALPCFAALLATLALGRRDRRALLAAPLLLALWQNLHPSAPLGVGAVAVYALAASLRDRPHARDLWCCLGASTLALLATHRPWDRLGAGFGHVADARMAELITEWAPLLARDGAMPWAFSLYALLLLALAGLRAPRRPPPEALVLALVCTAQSFRAVRFVPFGALALAPLALRGAAHLTASIPLRTRGFVALIVSAALAVPLLGPQRRGFGAGVNPNALPVGATRFLATRATGARLLNEFTFGGYLLWALGPRFPVFLDGRSLALWDIDFVDRALRAREPELGAMLDAHRIDAVVHRTSGLLTWMGTRPGWSVVYFDDTAFVAVRDASLPTLAAQEGFRTIHPGDWASDVSLLRADPARLEAAWREVARARRNAPAAALPWVTAGAAHLAMNDLAGAERAFSAAAAIHPESVPPHRGLLMVCVLRGDARCTCRRARAVLARAPGNRYAREAAARARCPGE